MSDLSPLFATKADVRQRLWLFWVHALVYFLARVSTLRDGCLFHGVIWGLCPASFAKIFHFLFDPNHRRLCRRPASLEGRIAIVTDVEAGCGGRGVRLRRGRISRTAKTCGPDAPTLASSFAVTPAKRRWQKSPVTGESSAYAVKTIAWGMSGDPGDLAVNTRVHTCYPHAHTRLRVRLAPGIPRALIFEGGTFAAKPGQYEPRDREAVSANRSRHAPNPLTPKPLLWPSPPSFGLAPNPKNLAIP
jgi:hypothetical protein